MIILNRNCLQSPLMFLHGIQSVRQRERMVLEFNPRHLSQTLIAWHQAQYPWHHRDTVRSYTATELRAHGNNGKRTDFAYANRAREYFGYDQIKEHRIQPNKLICLWDPSTDGDQFGEHNPCLVLVRFQEEGSRLNMTVVYRKRDLLTRMIGNFAMQVKWLQDEATRRKLRPGVITDFSMSVQYDRKRLVQHLREVQ